jgi:hypothetical protein
MKSIETIEQELYGWQQSQELREIVVRQLKRSLNDKILESNQRKRQINREIKELKNEVKLRNRALNSAKRDLREAKKNVEKFKRMKSGYNYQIKIWTNRNVGKLISKIEKGEENAGC